MLDVLGRVAGLVAEQAAVDPEVAGLLLRQRVVGEAAAHRGQQLPAVRATEVVALARPADERERLARRAGRGSQASRCAMSASASSQPMRSNRPSGFA